MPDKQNEKPRRSWLSVLITVLFFGFVLTSGMLGYILGRNTAAPTGELVDTIVLSPGESAVSSVNTLCSLSGRLLHTGGAPFSGAEVQLGGSKKVSVTDENGKFYFSGLYSGRHTLAVRDNTDTALTELHLSLDFSGAEISADFGSDPAFKMSEDAKMLELTLTVDDDRNISIDDKTAYFVTTDGQIVDFNGGALRVQGQTVALTPVGSMVDSSGTVLLPNRELLLTPAGTEITPPESGEVMPGVTVDDDGAANIVGGTVVLPDGEIKLPDGATMGGTDSIIIITDEEVDELPTLPDEYVPPQNSVAAVPGDTPADDVDGTPADDTPESDDELSSAPPESTPAEEDVTEYGGLDIIDTETGVSWKQQSIINLFKKRGSAAEQKQSGEIEIIAPGSNGYYEFRLKNPEKFDIAYNVYIKELSFHLPLRFSVVNKLDNYSYLYRERVNSDGTPLKTKQIIIPAESEQNFRIDWEWAYEDWFRRKEDDAVDTAAAQKETDEERTYMLSVLIEAAQIPGEPIIDWDGNIRYPGVH